MKHLPGSILLLTLAAGCANVPLSPGHRSARPVSGTDGWSASAPAGDEAVLYARDGTPVRRTESTTAASTAGEGEAPPRGIQAEGAASRPYMLELYQSAVQRGDDLALEVEALDRRLHEAEQREAEQRQRVRQLEEQLAALTDERDRIQAQSFELASRLTTAQVRRLEAEKLLLETMLEQTRAESRAEEIEEATGFAPAAFAERPAGSDQGQDR